MMSEIKIGDHTYRIGRLDARKQFHVARRLAPVLAGLSGGAAKAGASLVAQLMPIADALSKMADEDVDYVLDSCLAVCQRAQQGGQFAAVTVPSGGLMFQDIDMAQMIQLTVAVIQGNMAGFFAAAPADLPVGGGAQA
ncbi:phage tail assembly chaperone [Herbaspirillum huttiense]|uniref:phage tail assembly chaperone n=1 Tax=Herbaspirillum huttiense TaxID=863372 RepID=UPI0031DDC2B5